MSNHIAVCDLMAENGRLTRENEALRKALEEIAGCPGRLASSTPISTARAALAEAAKGLKESVNV